MFTKTSTNLAQMAIILTSLGSAGVVEEWAWSLVLSCPCVVVFPRDFCGSLGTGKKCRLFSSGSEVMAFGGVPGTGLVSGCNCIDLIGGGS